MFIYVIIIWHEIYVPVAQPDRVFGYEPKGRGFESLQARQKEKSHDSVTFLFVLLSIIFSLLSII